MTKINKRQENEIILKRPRVTEKATLNASSKAPVYTFEVAKEVNKIQIKKAVETLFKVKPVKIRIINLPAKKVRLRGTVGTRSGVKKTLVYLKVGESINVI